MAIEARERSDQSEPPRLKRASLKRTFLGKPLATAALESERLGKAVALAVFSSDNLSSVAYATEEILRVLIPVVGLAAFSYVLPISIVIVAIEAILVFSYRQTIKAYPTAGGAYIVTKDNFGLLPAQIAGVGLLSDYVLTVAVSVAAGTQAISSVVPVVHTYRIVISLVFVWLIAYANLLGVRESGRLFAVPTFAFIASLYLTIFLGLFKVVTGSLHGVPISEQASHGLPLGTGAITVFILLKAFASGGAAVTGVEAISNGVPAFKKPEAQNARTTLVWMASILGISFLGVSYLAAHLHVVPTADESKSVLAQIGQLVYSRHGVGGYLFLVLQATTTLILVLAANTSFADFPRLANFHAGDAFLPRQFTKRGHRLVFSNGIIALAAVSSVVLIAFKASVTNLIPLYALGVFISFTMSQAGMSRRHFTLREPKWRTGLLINGIGAIATAIVTVVIAVVKFKRGAWMMLIAVPVLVFALVRVNRTYEAEDEELKEGLSNLSKSVPKRHVAVVLVEHFDQPSINAVSYAATVNPDELIPLYLAASHEKAAAIQRSWSLAGPSIPLHIIVCDEKRSECLAKFVKSKVSGDCEVTVMVPGPHRLNRWERFLRGRSWAELMEPLRAIDGVSLVSVKDRGRNIEWRSGRILFKPEVRHRVIIMVGRLDRSVVKAVRYAQRLHASDTVALHIAVDPDRAQQLMDDWLISGKVLDLPLDVNECFDRDVRRVVSNYVSEVQRPDEEITIVLPRLEYPSPLHRLLHDRTSREIAGALDSFDRVHVVNVPYRLGLSHGRTPLIGAPAAS